MEDCYELRLREATSEFCDAATNFNLRLLQTSFKMLPQIAIGGCYNRVLGDCYILQVTPGTSELWDAPFRAATTKFL